MSRLLLLAVLLAHPVLAQQQVCFGFNETSNSFNNYPLPITTRVGVQFTPPFAASIEEIDWFGPLVGTGSFSLSGFIVEIRTQDPATGLPSNNILASVTASTILPSPNGLGWQDGTLPQPVIVSPPNVYWVTFKSSSNSPNVPPLTMGVETAPAGPDVTPYSLQTGGTWSPIAVDQRWKVRFESTNCFATPPVDYQVNQIEAAHDINGVVGSGSNPAIATVGVGQGAVLLATSSLVGMPWEFVFGAAPLIPASLGAPVGPQGQIVNVDLGDPTLAFLFNGFQGPGFQNVALPFTPTAPGALSLQMAVVDPAAAIGVRLSQATRLVIQ